MKNKNAFSLSELMAVLVVVGLITVVSTYAIQERFRDFYSRYYTAYDALFKAAHNTYVDTYCRTDIDSADNLTDCKREQEEDGSGTDYTKTGRPFPDTPLKLCKRLTEYLNATAESECKETTVDNADDSEFNNDNLQFTLTNGYKFYFSPSKTISINDGDSGNKTIKYYIVYVDLNGSASPNTAIKSVASVNKSVKPDIVPFIVTYTGDVILVGDPVFDKTYVSARVIDSQQKQTKSYTVDEARQLAFGDTPYEDIPFTLIKDFNNVLPSKIKPTNTTSHTMNGNGVWEIPETASMECQKGTNNCILSIDENKEKRY